MKRIITVAQSNTYVGLPPRKLLRFAEWLQGVIDLVPEEYIESAEIDIDVEEKSYGGYCPTIDITYSREETPEEVAEKITAERNRKRLLKERELRELERLKRKYELPDASVLERKND
jgi:hypothetical protein